MNALKAKRTEKLRTLTFNAPPEKVFPLLCPVKEFDWIDGWNCEVVYTQSGVAENNCIFTTHFPNEGDEVWVCCQYEPQNNRISYIRTAHNFKLARLSIALTGCGDGATKAEWRTMVTALSEKGNQYIDNFTDEQYNQLTTSIESRLNHYLKTGEKLITQDYIQKQFLHAEK